MLETIITKSIIFYAMGITAVLGVLGKIISQITLRKMVKSAGEIGKSNHKLMKLVKAKFEHASMVSDRVQNVEVFVNKYIFEYKTLGLRLYTWRGLLKKCMWILGILGTLGMLAGYRLDGMGELTIQYGIWTSVGVVLLFLIHISTDDEYMLQMTENYIVDYLENVCAHRYAKANQTVLEEEKEDILAVQQTRQEEEEESPLQEKSTEREKNAREIRIREILQEFLA